VYCVYCSVLDIVPYELRNYLYYEAVNNCIHSFIHSFKKCIRTL